MQTYIPLRKKTQKHINSYVWITRSITNLKRDILKFLLKRKTDAESLTTYVRSFGSELRQMLKYATDLYLSVTLYNFL